MRRILLLPLLAVLVPIIGCGLTYNCILSPSITGQPSSESVASGQPARFSIAASGTAPLSYQWLRNGVAIAGATQATYTTPATSSADSGAAFSVTVSNIAGTLTSLPATLTVTAPTPVNASFVAPNGSDSNPGTIAQPFKTIQHCATTVAAGWTCELRAGTYRETVVPNSGITITAYNLEPVTVDGSDPITGWTNYQGSIYKTNVVLNSDDTNQIFVGNDMMTEARWPNGDDLLNVNWATEQTGTDSGHIVDSNLPQVNWTGAKVHLWSGIDPFSHETGVVTSSGAASISIAVEETGTCPFICPTAGGYYYLFGTLSALDVAREWYYDPTSTTLYFMAPGEVDPSTLDVRAKQRQYAFDLRGKSGVTIRNISLFASNIITDASSSNNTLDGLNVTYVSHFTDLPPDPSDTTGFSILHVHETDSGIVLNGTGNVLQNSVISYSAGAGVAVDGSNNTVRNNLIENIDYIGDYDSAVDLEADGNTVVQNTIHSVGRQAIYLYALNSEQISYNNIFESMMLSRDGGEIYTCCDQASSGTRIHHNWLHDSLSLVPGAADDYTVAGVDIDGGSNGFEIDQNVLWNNEYINIFVDGMVQDALNHTSVHNNTVPDKSAIGRVTEVSGCSQTSIDDNRVAVGVKGPSKISGCDISNNKSNAPGATDMSTSTSVGCNFEGCSSSGPPAFSEGGQVSPCPVSVFAKP